MHEEVILNPRFSIVCTAVWTAVFAASFANAQTPANVIVAAGNGQLICSGCANSGFQFFSPISALVTDANGNIIPNTPVTWTVTSGAATIGGGSTFTQYTDATGTSSVTPFFISTIFQQFGVYTQPSVITAQAGSAVSSFEMTSALSNNGSSSVGVNWTQTPVYSGAAFTGTAGGTGTPFTVNVYSASGQGVPNVSVRLINDDGTSGPSPSIPSAYCQTGSGADPWSVLTDANGNATCTPVFGPVGGSTHQVAILVGGLPAGEWGVTGQGSVSAYNPGAIAYSPSTSQPLPGYGLTAFFNLTVKAAAVGSVTVTGGNNQTAVAGSALANPLVATVLDSTGKPLASQTVTWTYTPGSVQLSNTTTTTNASGQVSTNATFTSLALGAVTIKVTSATNSNAVATFTEIAVAPVTVSSLTKVGGDGQSAIVGTTFANPLQVQLTTSSGSAVGLPVSFTVSGPATLSAASATTSSSGIAQVTAIAGSSSGNVTVTASYGTASVTFSLVVVPQGPTITASSFVNGADLQKGSISACGLATLAASGVAPAVAGTLVAPLVGPLPYQLGNTSVTFSSSDAAPMISVSSNAITFLVPCDLTAGAAPVTVNASGGTTTVSVTLLPASPGIFQTVQADGVTRAVIERPDGSFASPSNPARRGETVTAFVTGLGPVSPSVSTNALPIPGPAGYSTGTPSAASGQVIVGVASAGTQVLSSVLSPTQPGVFLITFQIPQGAPQANNVVFSVGVVPPNATTAYYSAGSQIPVQ